MKEAYVSFKVAKLLKEKGFDIPPDTSYEVYLWQMYDEDGEVHWGMYNSDWYFRITQQMAMQWIRMEKMIFISPFPTFKSSPTFKSLLPYSWRVDIKSCFGEELGGNYEYITYEDAVEAALEYVLTYLI